MRLKVVPFLVTVSTLVALGSVALAASYPYDVIVPHYGGTALTASRLATGNHQSIYTASIGGSYNGRIYSNITSNGTNHLSSTNGRLYVGNTVYFDTSAHAGEKIQGLFWTAWWVPVYVQVKGNWSP